MIAIGGHGITKRYGALVANHDVTIEVKRGSAHALVGENGAGKSTLMKILYGLERADAGDVIVDDEVIARPSVADAIARKVGMVHQHFMLVPTLSVAENVVLGDEPLRGGLVDIATAARKIDELARSHGLAVDPHRLVGDLSVGEAQRIEILKVLYRGARTLILDEPTAILTPLEVAPLIAMLRGLVAGGATVLLVTHKLGEVLALADEVTVLRRGEVVDRRATRGLSAEALGAALVGHSVVPLPVRSQAAADEARLVLDNVSVDVEGAPRLEAVSLTVRSGEIVGIAGVEGNGQRELAEVCAGLTRPSAGVVRIDGRDVGALDIAARHALGLAFVPEDRHEEGLLLDAALWENVYLGREAAYGRAPLIPEPAVRADTQRAIADFDVRAATPDATLRTLSGGNQQKLLLARELLRAPRVLVCAQPTRGVDVGAIAEIHARLLALADAGAAILLLSAELDELFALADRVIVLYRGHAAGEHVLRNADREATRARIGAEMVGLSAEVAV
jgi:simple sugar transport system ATP-binding protein